MAQYIHAIRNKWYKALGIQSILYEMQPKDKV